MESGQDYKESPNVIAINIVNYEFMPQVPAFHTGFHVGEDRYRDVLLTGALEIHFIRKSGLIPRRSAPAQMTQRLQ
jgi:hypothetical protein